MNARSVLPWVVAASIAVVLWYAGRGPDKPPPPATEAAPEFVHAGPIDEETRAKRSRPESVSAAELVDALTDIRYALAREAPASRALIDEIGAHSRVLRRVRREPDAVPWASLAAETDELLRHVAESPWGQDPAIVTAVERSRTALLGPPRP